MPVVSLTQREKGPSLNYRDCFAAPPPPHACLNFITREKYGAITAAILRLFIHGWTLYHCGMLWPDMRAGGKEGTTQAICRGLSWNWDWDGREPTSKVQIESRAGM